MSGIEVANYIFLVQFQAAARLLIERPDDFRIDFDDSDMVATVWADEADDDYENGPDELVKISIKSPEFKRVLLAVLVDYLRERDYLKWDTGAGIGHPAG